MDFYFTQNGDITVSSTGDIGMTDTPWRDDAQQAYIRLMTEPGDWVLYPTLGADLTQLYGKPQSIATAELGKSIIRAALDREGRFSGKSIYVNAVPTGPQTIRFDVYVASQQADNLLLSIEQSLGVVL